MKLKKITRPFQVKNISDDGSFSGYATVFGTPDYYGDIIMPGALDDTIRDLPRGNVPCLWQHDDDDPIGTYPVMRTDTKGLYVEGQLCLGVRRADEAHLLLKAKVINGMSMGFNTIDDAYANDGNRMIKKLDLWEISLVTFPAKNDARVTDVKKIEGLATLAQCEQLLRDVGGFSAKEAKTIVSRIKTAAPQRDADGSAEIKKALSILKGN